MSDKPKKFPYEEIESKVRTLAEAGGATIVAKPLGMALIVGDKQTLLRFHVNEPRRHSYDAFAKLIETRVSNAMKDFKPE